VKSHLKPTASSKNQQSNLTASMPLTARGESKLGKKEKSASKASHSPLHSERREAKEGTLLKTPSRLHLALDFKPKHPLKPASTKHRKPLQDTTNDTAEQPRLLAPHPIAPTTLQDKFFTLKHNL
jgi:hypothetical protein